MSEDKKPITTTVQDVKEISPLSEVYQLNRYDRYLIVVPASNLVGGNELALERARMISTALKKLEIKHIVMIATPELLEGVRFLEFREEKKS